MDWNEFIPICIVGTFCWSLSDMKQPLNLHLIRSPWFIGSWPNQQAGKIAISKNFVSFSKCPHYCQKHAQYQKIWKAFSGFCYLCYTVWGVHCITVKMLPILKNEHLQHCLFSVSLTPPAYSSSSLISVLFIWISMQHLIFMGKDNLLLP